MDELRQDNLDSFPHLNEKVELYSISLESNQEQITSFGLTDEEIQQIQVTQKGSSWERNPIGAKQLEELDLHWSTPATKCCTSYLPFSYLPYLEYQHHLSLCYMSPTLCTPHPLVIHPLSYQYVSERRMRKRQEAGTKLIRTSGAVISNLHMIETLYSFESITVEKIKHQIDKTNNNTNITIVDDKDTDNITHDDNGIKIKNDKPAIENDKGLMTILGDDPEFMKKHHMSFSYFKPERDISNFESIQRTPNTEWSMHNECELDNYRFRFD